MPHYSRQRKFALIAIPLFLIAGALLVFAFPRSGQAESQKELKHAWSRLNQLGKYEFSTTIEQTTFLAPKITNVGQTSSKEIIHLQGETNLRSESMFISLWKNGGNALSAKDGVEIRVENGVASGRSIGDETWSDIDSSFTNSFAPGNDVSSFLVSARNVSVPDIQEIALPQSDGSTQSVRVSHYRFDLDSNQFALYMRDQLTRELQRSGKLPADLTLDVSDEYRNMVANGEVWLDRNGYPLRLSLDMNMPQQKNGERVTARIQSDFLVANAGALMATASWPEKISFWISGVRESAQNSHALAAIVLSLASLAFAALIVAYSRSKQVYAGVALTVILSMVISPLWQANKVYAFADEQRQQQAQQSAEQAAESKAEAETAGLVVSDWNPHQSPADQIEPAQSASQPSLQDFSASADALMRSLADDDTDTSADADSDGLSDSYEAQFDVTVLNPNDSDTDNDGLPDGQEVKLGLKPGGSDTDNDGIDDATEVVSFYFNDRDWYINPLDNDTDKDGILDGVECMQRVLSTDNPTPGLCQDTDNDGTPDVFDADDDGDGVPSIVDEAPLYKSDTLYNQSSPFKLSVDNIGSNLPVFINYQLQPENLKHLTYTLNVLDWPTGDADGQIQRVSDTNFGDTMTSSQREGDPKASYGDMRLIPMAEVRLKGSGIPLPLTDHFDFALSSDSYTGKFRLTASGASATKIKLLEAPAGSYTISTAPGTCKEFGQVASLGALSANGEGEVSVPLADFADGEYSIFVKDSTNTTELACVTVPVAAHGTLISQVIDQQTLSAYGATARNDTNGEVLIYAPLSLVYDSEGAVPTAFSARIPFFNQNAAFEDSSQEVRAVWLLNMLTDQCKPIPSDYNESDSGVWCDKAKSERWYTDLPKVVQTYNDSFKLTGLSVVEDHGVNLGVIFENPATDADLTYDNQLWGLAQGLSGTFLAGRSADNTNRDITVDEIQHRFDPTRNSDYPDEVSGDGPAQLWGLPRDAFKVLKYQYNNADGIVDFISTQADKIFTEYFDADSLATQPDLATLLFAREETQRSMLLGDQTDSCASGVCVFNFENQKARTQALVNWAPYERTTQGWSPYPLEDYLDRLEATLRQEEDQWYSPADETDDARALADGHILLARMYYEGLYRGMAGLVEFDHTPVINIAAVLEDQNIFNSYYRLNSKAQLVTKVVTTCAESFGNALKEDPALIFALAGGIATKSVKDTTGTFFKALGKGLYMKTDTIRNLLSTTFRRVIGGVVVGVVAVVVAASAIMYMIDSNSLAGKIGGRILFAAIGLLTTGLAIKALKDAVDLLRAAKSVSAAAQTAAIIGAVVGTVITWGVFFVQWGMSGVGFGSLAFNSMLADAIAATILVILMAALSCTVVGAIVVAVIGLIDGLIASICAIAGAHELAEDHWVRQYVCIGISGWLVKIIKWTIYSQTYLIDYDNGDRLKFTSVEQTLRDPSIGMVADNDLALDIGVENTITRSSVPLSWMALLYYWQFANIFVKSASFRYKIQTSEGDIHDGLDRNTTDWTKVSSNSWKASFTASTDGASISMPSAGINQDPTAYFTEGSAVPVQECWLIPLWPYYIPVCYIRTERASFNIPIGESLTLDVFPNTLDEFYSLAANGDGYALDWANSTTLSFPVLQDADGDTLRSRYFTDGNDPDDNNIDTDNDGLMDGFEVSNGMNPQLFDTDQDGLTDAEEIRYSTDPLRQDTDGDGLPDAEEVQGWLFTYGFTTIGEPLETYVYADPTSPDTDLDGITDLMEKIYGYNPRVPESASVLQYALSMRELDAPLALLKFDESGGATGYADASNFGFNGVCVDSAACPGGGYAGRVSNSAQFDGGDVVTLPNTAQSVSLSGNQPFTLSAWVYRTSDGRLLEKWNNSDSTQQEVRFEFTSNGRLSLTGGSGSLTSTSTVAASEWTHVAVVFDGASQAAFYINGQTAGSGAWSNAAARTGAPIEIGAGYTGLLDEVAVFDRALSADEINQRLMPANYNLNDSFVRPGEYLTYRSTVTNLLNSRFAYGLLTTVADYTDAIVDWAVKFLPKTFILGPDNPVVTQVNEETFTETIQIDPAITETRDLTITQTAQAQIVDRRTESNLAELWLKFDEGSGVSEFEDTSGNMPPRDVACSSGCPTSGATGILNNAVTFAASGNTPLTLPTLDTMDLPGRGYTISMWVNPQGTSTAGAQLNLLSSSDQRLQLSLSRVNNSAYAPVVKVNNASITLSAPSGFSRNVAAGVWNHLVLQYNSAGSLLNLYINGALSGSANSVSNILAGDETQVVTLGGSPQGAAYTVDDLRVFNRPLTAVDINRLAERPVLILNMESGFADSSVYNQPVSAPKQAPVASSNSVKGSSLDPRSGANTGFIQVSGNSQLNLNDGSFTISTWVYPETNAATYWQGIFGKRTNMDGEDDTTAYPTLERRGTNLRFSYGTGSSYETLSPVDALTENRWNHVVVTFAPNGSGQFAMELFVNAVLKGSKLFSASPASQSSFFVGHSSTNTRFTVTTINMDNEHDAGSHAEPYLEEYVNGGEIWQQDWGSVGDGDVITVNHTYSNTNFSHVKYEVWEDDTTGDDFCGSYEKNWYEPAETAKVTLDDGFDGFLNVTYNRPSMSFSGKIDQMEMYRYPLDSEQIYDLYHSIPITAQHPLDDRPASTTFDNRAVVGVMDDGICTQPNCPAAGVAGLINQAARFDGVDDIITTPVQTTPEYMASLWLNTTCESCGVYTLKGDAGTALSQIYMKSGNVCALTGSIELCSTGGGVNDGQWRHVLYTYSSAEASLRLDGNIANRRLSNPALAAAPNGHAVLGQAEAAANDNFYGQLDDVRVFRYIDSAQISTLLQRAPLFMAHLDESDPAAGMSDATLSDWTLSCASPDGCPTGDRKGRLGKSIEFDGVDDRVALDQTRLSTSLTDFSIGVWVNPSRQVSQDQTIWALNRADNGGIKYAISMPENELKLCVQTSAAASTCDSNTNVGLILNTWNYVMLTVRRSTTGGETYSLYINGYLDSTGVGAADGSATNGAGRLTLGNTPSGVSMAGGPFAGQLDEPTISAYQLNEIDVRNTFNYQMASVEESSSLKMTIDADEPTVQLVSYDAAFPYLSQADRMLQVDASDATAGLAMLEMTVAHNHGTSYQSAPVCLDSANGSAYCPTFIPQYGDGTYTLAFRAVDRVGHSTTSTSSQLFVDSRAPVILSNVLENQLVPAELSPTLENTWQVNLSGAINDETLSDGAAGAGVDIDSVRVTLFSANGEIVGSGAQKPTLTPAANGYTWELDYLIPEQEPTGQLTVVVEAQDRVTNQGQSTFHILLDATPAASTVDPASLPDANAISPQDTPSLSSVILRDSLVQGSASDIPSGAPYLTDAGEAANSNIAQVQVSFEPTQNASYLFNQPYPDGVLAWLPLDTEEVPTGADGQANPDSPERRFIDISPYQISGVCSGDECPQTGILGHSAGSIYFDGQRRAINLGQQVDLAGRGFTVSVWAKRDQIGENNPILWQGPASIATQRILFGLNAEDRFVCGFGGSDLVSAEAFSDLDWHQWTCSFDLASGQRVIYRDGQEIGRDSAAPLPSMSENLYLGYAPVGSFKGYLDELVILDHSLSAADVRQQYTGDQAVFSLGVTHKYLQSGDTFADESGFYHPLTLVNSRNDLGNRVGAGQVGLYALDLTGNDKVVVEPSYALALDRGAFTLAAWVNPGASSQTRDIISMNDENPEARYPSLSIEPDGRVAVRFGDGYAWNSVESAPGAVVDGQWSHVLASFNGQTLKIYINGGLAIASDALAGKVPFPAQRFNVGDGFIGLLDGVKVFSRALTVEEIEALAVSGWGEAQTTGSGAQLNWSRRTPAGLEGPYQIDSRAWDGLGHLTTDGAALRQWTGLVDTLLPRLSVQRAPKPDNADLMHYTFEITDLMLDEDSIHMSICSEPVVQREYFNSPWYLAGGVAPNTSLYRLTGECDGPANTSEQVGLWACDSAGNCASQVFTPNLTQQIYLPAVLAPAGTSRADATVAHPTDEERAQAEAWPLLAPAFTGDPNGELPALNLMTETLTPDQLRNQGLLNIQGSVADADGVASVRFTISQNGQALFSNQASISGDRWNGAWIFMPGHAPADGVYEITVAAVDNAGQTTELTRSIQVQLSR